MGWTSGGELADKIESIMKKAMDKFTPQEIEDLGRDFAEAFMDMDCDVLDECGGFIGDAANRINSERHLGAPRHPKDGEVYTDKWKNEWTFDGKRWV